MQRFPPATNASFWASQFHEFEGRSTAVHRLGLVLVTLTRLNVASRLLLRGQHRFQIGEWIEGGGWRDIATVAAPVHVFELGMFVFVAVRAEQFPIAAIRSVVVVVIVLVMNFQ